MAAQLTFPLNPWRHDPSGQPMDYSLPLPIASTETLTTVTVVAVDDSDVPIVGDSLTIYNVATGIINGAWWVTMWVEGGTAGTVYKLRARWTLSDGRGSDKTVRLSCANT